MKLAMIGLGRMGANMVRRLVRDGHELVVFDVDADSAAMLADELDNVAAASSLDELVRTMTAPRVIWLMVPHQFVDQSIESLINAGMTEGDLLVDGGNSNFNLSKQRAADLQVQGIHFVDSGTSGGIWGWRMVIASWPVVAMRR